MLRVAKVGMGAEQYYLAVAWGTGSGAEAAGRWQGQAAVGLGLRGDVGAADLSHLLAGDDPAGGRPLGRRDGRMRVAAFDLTFCAPKSVSLLHALGDPDVAQRVGAAHDAAVVATLGYVERHAAAVRRAGMDRRIPVATDGLAVAAFEHRTSRALDPHLHTHAVVANLGRGDGRWSALDGRGVFAHRAAADALYHAHLRHHLSARLGVQWTEPSRGRADLVGIGAEARLEFSQRAAAIAAHLAARGATGRAAADVAALATRPPKDPGLSADDLRAGWRRRAALVGLGPTRLASVVGRVTEHERADMHDDRDVQPEEVVRRGRSAIARRDVVRALGSRTVSGRTVTDVEDAAERLLTTWGLEPGSWGGPGVAESRFSLDDLGHMHAVDGRQRSARAEPAHLAHVLAQRGMAQRGPRPGFEQAPELGYGLGYGLGMG